MNIKAPEGMSSAERIAFYDCEENRKYYQYGTAGGWKKYGKNPVFGGDYGTCFDVSLLLEEGKEGMPVFKMWFSWRPKRAVGYTESTDGIHWENPCAVLEPLPGSSWEADEINRPAVIHHNGQYMMWYSGQMKPYLEDGRSVIGLAVSSDGIHWERRRIRHGSCRPLCALMCYSMRRISSIKCGMPQAAIMNLTPSGMLPALTESIGKNMRITLCYPGIKLICGNSIRWWLPALSKKKAGSICFMWAISMRKGHR